MNDIAQIVNDAVAYFGSTEVLGTDLLIGYVLAVNIVTFVHFWLDKRRSIAGTWRIPENTLLSLAFIGGSPGAVAAQRILRHKTRKEPFRSRLLWIVGLHVVLVCVSVVPSSRNWLIGPLFAGLEAIAIQNPSGT